MILLLLSLRKKTCKMENLSYFNLNSTEDCDKRGKVASFIASTFDQCFLNCFVPNGIRETRIFCVTGYKLLINRVGSVRMRGGFFRGLMRVLGGAGCRGSSVVLQRIIA